MLAYPVERVSSVMLRSAIDRGDLKRVRLLASGVARVRLDDALRICLLVRDQDRGRYEAAAVRWLGRLALETPGVGIDDLRRAAAALELLPRDADEAMASLSSLCVRLGLDDLEGRSK